MLKIFRPIRTIMIGMIALSVISLSGCLVDRDRDRGDDRGFHEHERDHDHDFHEEHHDHYDHGMSQSPRDIVASTQ